MQQQQGDVTIEKIERVPDGAKKLQPEGKGYVLAKGEATGHAHVIEETDLCELYENEGTLYVRALQPVTLKHDEHKVQVITAGIWQIGQVREYDYFTEMDRRVRD